MEADEVLEPGRATVGYMLSRFPKVSETFILMEIVELERRGVRVEVFPLMREREDVVHPEAEDIVRRAQFVTPISRPVLAAQLYWLRVRHARISVHGPTSSSGMLGHLGFSYEASSSFRWQHTSPAASPSLG